MKVGICSADGSLFRFMQRLIDELKEVGKFGNARVYRDSLNAWKMYRNDKDLDLRRSHLLASIASRQVAPPRITFI